MNAIQPSGLPPQPTPKRRVPRHKRHQRLRSYQVMALETTAKIGVNIVISATALSALTQLLPYHWLQQEKLREIRTEIKIMELRVNNLHSQFSRSFDPRQAQSIMQEQSNRFAPNQRQVVLPKDATEVQQSEAP